MYPFFTQGMVAFLAHIAIYSNLNFNEGIAVEDFHLLGYDAM
jgi:hypothetical protein